MNEPGSSRLHSVCKRLSWSLVFNGGLNRWLHTDLMNLSHFHTHLLFESLVTEGNLK